jgi:hypothetical protein
MSPFHSRSLDTLAIQPPHAAIGMTLVAVLLGAVIYAAK